MLYYFFEGCQARARSWPWLGYKDVRKYRFYLFLLAYFPYLLTTSPKDVRLSWPWLGYRQLAEQSKIYERKREGCLELSQIFSPQFSVLHISPFSTFPFTRQAWSPPHLHHHRRNCSKRRDVGLRSLISYGKPFKPIVQKSIMYMITSPDYSSCSDVGLWGLIIVLLNWKQNSSWTWTLHNKIM